MMRLLIALILLASALPALAVENWWSGLWHNADQRGEALLQQGDAAAAAKVYGDPRRKAYATLMSGDYARAAQDLKAFDDSDANYNRGNALAHAGDLKGALDAYDAALKRDPNNKDARHNRDLVANALKQKQSRQQNASGKQSPGNKSGGKSGEQSKGDKGNQSGPGQQKPSSSSGGNGKNNGQGQSSANSQGQSANPGQANKPSAAAQSGTAQNAPGNTKAQQGNPQQSGASDNTATTGQKDSAAQARRDAAASLSQATPSAQKNGGASTADANGALGDGTVPRAAPSEKQLAQDQWLRSIPDDPGGLLRRKFLVEYMMRHKGAQP
ncbi:MAG: tetratricopeptide repeat protein [Georgfuchsia sp.]